MSKVIIGAFAACLCLEAGAFAHHSVTVNFDASRAMDLTGRLKEVDIRNPHSRITLEVKQPDGTVKEWLIEWSDRNALLFVESSQPSPVSSNASFHAWMNASVPSRSSSVSKATVSPSSSTSIEPWLHM